MSLLAFDSTATACSAAVWSNGRVLAHQTHLMDRGHAERLVPVIWSVMQEAEIAFKVLEAIVVTVGPGSFTGIRIGLSTAKCLALVGKIPLFGVTNFDLHKAVLPPEDWLKGPVMVVLETKRDDFYVQIYGRDKNELGSAEAVPSDALAQHAIDLAGTEAPITLAGDGAMRAGCLMKNISGLRLLWMERPYPDALNLATLAASVVEAGSPAAFPEPFYLRPPDVRRPVQGKA